MHMYYTQYVRRTYKSQIILYMTVTKEKNLVMWWLCSLCVHMGVMKDMTSVICPNTAGLCVTSILRYICFICNLRVCHRHIEGKIFSGMRTTYTSMHVLRSPTSRLMYIVEDVWKHLHGRNTVAVGPHSSKCFDGTSWHQRLSVILSWIFCVALTVLGIQINQPTSTIGKRRCHHTYPFAHLLTSSCEMISDVTSTSQ
jgi:hypothetical protein